MSGPLPLARLRDPLTRRLMKHRLALQYRLAVETHDRNLAAIQRVAGASFGAPTEVWQIAGAVLAGQAERPDPARSERSSTSNDCGSLSGHDQRK